MQNELENHKLFKEHNMNCSKSVQLRKGFQIPLYVVKTLLKKSRISAQWMKKKHH